MIHAITIDFERLKANRWKKGHLRIRMDTFSSSKWLWYTCRFVSIILRTSINLVNMRSG